MVEAYGDKIGDHPVGTGPFVFGEHVAGSHWTGKKFDGYFEKGKPHLNGYIALFVAGAPMVNALAAGERLRVDSSGNVGIANTTPSEKLSVNGSGTFTSKLYAGGYYPTGAGNFNSYTLEVGGPSPNTTNPTSC